MFAKSLLPAVMLLGVLVTPAFAVPFCQDDRSGVSFGFGIGSDYSETEQNDFDLMALRQAGVDATSVEKWNGCIRAYVRQPGGGERMEFYDPNTLRQVF